MNETCQWPDKPLQQVDADYLACTALCILQAITLGA